MTTEGLIEAWLDGSLDDAGCIELARLVRADPTVSSALAAASRMDLLLGLAHGQGPRLVSSVMAGLRGPESRMRLRKTVMRSVAGRPAGRPVRRSGTSQPWWIWAAAIAASLIVVIGFIAASQRHATDVGVAPLANQPQVRSIGEILSVSAAVHLQRDGDVVAATVGMALLPGDQVTVSDGAEARVIAGDAQIELRPATDLILTSADAIELRQGTLHATVTPRPTGPALVFTTPHAEATVLGTILDLTSQADGTRLAVERGKVGLRSRGRPATIEVGAGGVAYARFGTDPAMESPLFIADLADWDPSRGHWEWRAGTVIGGSPSGLSRLVSVHRYADFVLSCRIRVTGKAATAEVQADDYAWFVQIPRDDAWHQVQITRRGDQRIARIDGHDVPILTEGGGLPTTTAGVLSFYVRDGAQIEIASASVVVVP